MRVEGRRNRFGRGASDAEPDYAARARAAAKTLASLITRSATPVGNTLAWALNADERRGFQIPGEKLARFVIVDADAG